MNVGWWFPRLLPITVVAIFTVSNPVRGQTLADAEAFAAPVEDVERIASDLSQDARSGTGDAEAERWFREIAGEVAILMSAIRSAALSGEDIEKTRPLYERSRHLLAHARRVSDAGKIPIDSLSLDDLAAAVDELERHYYPDTSDGRPASASQE